MDRGGLLRAEHPERAAGGRSAGVVAAAPRRWREQDVLERSGVRAVCSGVGTPCWRSSSWIAGALRGVHVSLDLRQGRFALGAFKLQELNQLPFLVPHILLKLLLDWM